jgi:hypothetical protein
MIHVVSALPRAGSCEKCLLNNHTNDYNMWKPLKNKLQGSVGAQGNHDLTNGVKKGFFLRLTFNLRYEGGVGTHPRVGCSWQRKQPMP